MEAEAVRQLRDAFARRLPLLAGAAEQLEGLARAGLDGTDHHHVDRVYFRVKSASSFVDKVLSRITEPPYSNPLSQVEDQIGGRVLVLFRHDIEPVVQILEQTFNRVELTHRTPQKDAEFGYESTHLICHIPDQARPTGWDREASMPETFELQVRTLFMHAWAEPQHDLGYKGPTDLTSDQRRHLAWIAASAWGADRGLEDAWSDIGLRGLGPERGAEDGSGP